MKRRQQFDSPPTPEYSECEEYECIKKHKPPASTHEFIRTIEDAMFEVIEPGTDSKSLQKVKLSANRNLVVVFFGIRNQYLSDINQSYPAIQQFLNTDIIGVSANQSTNENLFPVINGSSISKKYSVLDPVGGAVYPRDVMVMFDRNGVEKLRIPILINGKYVLDRCIVDVIVDGLEYVQTGLNSI